MTPHFTSIIKAIIRNIPKGINKRLANLSASEDIFAASTSVYQQALKISGHKHVLQFDKYHEETNTAVPKNTPPAKPNRRRSIIWYNPPFEGTVATNIGKEFFNILDTSFPAGHKLYKIFNRSSIKLSYSCMPNLKQIIDRENHRKLKQDSANNNICNKTCNCRKTDECPLQQQCMTSGVVYQATVTTKENNQTATYIGMTETPFKLRYANHTQSFRQEKYKNQTELSKYIWSLKYKKSEYNITWRILQRAKSYSTGSKKCNLCTSEKFYILCKPHMASLNTRVGLINTCNHRKKYLLSNASSFDVPRP